MSFSSFTICGEASVSRMSRKLPAVHVVAGLGLLSALGLMVTLPIDTWIRLAIWLVIGLTIFFTYARTHTNEKFASLAHEEAEG